MNTSLRKLPKVQTLMDSANAAPLIDVFGREHVTEAVREKIERARTKLLADAPMPEAILSERLFWTDISETLDQSREQSLKRVINASGIVIHTNLGRAPLAPEAIAAMSEIASTYSTLEFELDTGKRGSRHSHAETLICELTGAKAALVVNNCAGAILTVLSALANHKEVIASRGELVEIGGSFRMPDVITQSGATLKEVGTTNKTHPADYADAITESTALLLKSHTSNYAVVGFSASPTRGQLAEIAKANSLPLIEDLGSGVLVDLTPYGLPNEPVVKDVIAAGVDIVTFSGDKLLGGPQAGIIAGRKDLIDQIKRHPMARAVRVDKLSLAALIATLELYRAPSDPIARIPVLRKISEPIDLVRARAEHLADHCSSIEDLQTTIVPSKARAGGGSLPLQDLPSLALSLTHPDMSPDQLAEHLRAACPPVIGRISKEKLLIDLRTVSDEEISDLSSVLTTAFSS
ncbi:MAG: L-seryl-tRNA(Sec) selenium transferase [Henriciella sp.]|nr:L-seryl-tRNA(Sec) selenium transferase [Henriciella sp.]